MEQFPVASGSHTHSSSHNETALCRANIDSAQSAVTLPQSRELRQFRSSVDSQHVISYRHLICFLSDLYADGAPCVPTFAELATSFTGSGVYIGPESRGVFYGPTSYPIAHVLQIRDELLALSQRLFPAANELNVLGPELELPPHLDATQSAHPELGVYRGLDRSWPRELTEKSPSWAVCLHLWDPSYYFSIHTPTDMFESGYATMARALYQNMAEKSAILTSTLMRHEPYLEMFIRGVEQSGWRVVHLNPYIRDALLLLKGF